MGKQIRIVSTFLVLFSVLLLFGINWTWGNNGNLKFVGDELLIQPKMGVPNEKVGGIVRSYGATIASEIPQIRVKQLKVPSHALETVRKALSKNPHFNFVEYNYLAEVGMTPNDTYYPSQWHLPMISAPQGWDISTGSNSVVMAIIDSGVDPIHPDLSNKLIPGYNFLNGNSDTHDVLYHGTPVAGSAAAMGNNYEGVAGVAWTNPIMPLVVVDSFGQTTYYDIAQAITYAADHGAKIMNISIAGYTS